MAKTPTTGRTSSRKRRAGNSAAQTSSAGNGRSTSRHLVMNTDKDFIPWYEVPEDKRKVVDEIRAAGERAEDVYLATDPDREGEAIAWHVMEAAGWRSKPVRRVVFHSITEDAVKEAFAHERDIDMELVNAQQARRIEDRLVGFKLSPLLKPLVGQELNRNRNILTAEDLDTTSSLSAGRVQSVALRLVAERDKEIDAFVPVEYWSIDAALLTGENAAFTATLRSLVGEKDELSHTDEDP
ncbi:MAG: DNA topoisomerase I, partial [Chloroflexi bacterium]|nr:DNA topoisomerase I [Chloroflexota bacterium]